MLLNACVSSPPWNVTNQVLMRRSFREGDASRSPSDRDSDPAPAGQTGPGQPSYAGDDSGGCDGRHPVWKSGPAVSVAPGPIGIRISSLAWTSSVYMSPVAAPR